MGAMVVISFTHQLQTWPMECGPHKSISLVHECICVECVSPIEVSKREREKERERERPGIKLHSRQCKCPEPQNCSSKWLRYKCVAATLILCINKWNCTWHNNCNNSSKRREREREREKRNDRLSCQAVWSIIATSHCVDGESDLFMMATNGLLMAI